MPNQQAGPACVEHAENWGSGAWRTGLKSAAASTGHCAARIKRVIEFSLDDDVTAIDHECTRTEPARQGPFVMTLRRQGPFHALKGKGYKAIAAANVAPDEIRRVVASPECLLQRPEIQVVKQGRSALIVKTILDLSETETSVAYKRCGSRSWGRRILRSLQIPRAARNFHLADALLRAGIATPRPLLAVLPRWRAFFRLCYLATEWIEGAVPIDAFLRNATRFEAGKKQVILRAAAECLGHLLGTLHARGFTHRDLKATNLLMRESAGRVEAFVIDLDGAAGPWFISRRTRMTNLARLVLATDGLTPITHTLRQRFLRSYLTAAGDSAPWKAIWRQLDEISRIRRSRRAPRSRSGV
jgi:tRNA A-37 threonylcarbamoyl transferase component Bud32